MVFVKKNGNKIYRLSIFRFGTNKYSTEEEGLALMLIQYANMDFWFELDKFSIPEDFPRTETYEWEEIDVKFFPKLSEINIYSGLRYEVKDLDTLKEKFNI